MKKTIKDFDLNDKKVLIRVDFNVPIKMGVITDDNRIKESLKTINYAIEHNAKVILLSHLGRVKTAEDMENNTLEPVAVRLSELLNKKVIFNKETRGQLLEDNISKMENGDVLLIENTRFEDIDSERESKNDPELAKYWSYLGDIFINDAFGTSHRSHASNVGISSYLPSGIGFLVEKEVEMLETTLNNTKHPFTVILGGAKVSDKIGVIENLVKIADYILIGGGMAYTFLAAQGFEIGSSLLDEENIDFCRKMLKNYRDKIILPIDTITTLDINNSTNCQLKNTDDIKFNDIGVDIGPKTINLFKEYIDKSATIIWNGPMGIFEIENYANGTKQMLDIVSNNKGVTIIGGGDTASAAINFGYKDKFTHISTGGGASLEMLEGKKLEGIEVINEKC